MAHRGDALASGTRPLVAIWYLYLPVVLCFGFSPTNARLTGTLIALHACAALVLLLGIRRPLSILLFGGFALRLAILYLDLYTDFPIINSGRDTENYFQTAMVIYRDPSLFGESLYGGVFPKAVAGLFYFTGPSRLLVQYTNVLLAITGFVVCVAALRTLKAPAQASAIIGIAALMPMPAVMTSIFLRESVIFFGVAVSVLYFARWVSQGKLIDLAWAIVALGVASVFHFAVLGLALGYALTAIIYDRTENRWHLNSRGALIGIPIIGGGIAVLGAFPSLFLEKLDRVESIDDVFAVASGSEAGSAYLTQLQIDNLAEFIGWGWIKALFLMISPTPIYWRGLADVVSFMFDASFYIVAVGLLACVALRRQSSDHKRRVLMFLPGLLVLVFILGAGTSNAGSAMRHRHKALPVVAVATAMAAAATRPKSETTLQPSPRLPANAQRARRR